MSDLGPANFLHIYVTPLYRPGSDGRCKAVSVSMGWWLSKQVQLYLDNQIDTNCVAIELALQRLTKAPPTMLAPPSDYCRRRRAQITP